MAAVIGKVTSRGQITVPQALRESTGIAPNGYVAFRQVGRSLVVDVTEVSVADLTELLKPLTEEAKRQKLTRKGVLSEIKALRKEWYDERGMPRDAT